MRQLRHCTTTNIIIKYLVCCHLHACCYSEIPLTYSYMMYVPSTAVILFAVLIVHRPLSRIHSITYWPRPHLPTCRKRPHGLLTTCVVAGRNRTNKIERNLFPCLLYSACGPKNYALFIWSYTVRQLAWWYRPFVHLSVCNAVHCK